MHKISCFNSAETDVYRPFLPWPRCTFLLTYIIPRTGDKLKRPTKKSFHVFSFDDTEENAAVRFEGKKGKNAIYEITLCKHLDPDNKLPIDQSIRFLCVAHPV